MEKLGCPWHFHMGDDFWVCICYLHGTSGFSAFGKYGILCDIKIMEVGLHINQVYLKESYGYRLC